MPNEIKTNKASSIVRGDLMSCERRSHSSNDSITVFVWSMGGLIFAACSAGDAGTTSPWKSIELGTAGYEGARAYLDVNGDGVIDSENQIGITDSNGVVQLAPAYAYSRVLISLQGAMNLATGEMVTGSNTLLVLEALPGDNGREGFVFISPLTDMLAEGARAGLGTAQEQLDAIFGSDRVSERDVMNIDNYFGGRDTENQEEVIGSDITDSVVHQAVSRAALAIGALRSDPLLTSGTETSEYEKLRHLFTAFREESEEAISGANLDRYILRLNDGDLANEVVRLVFDNPFTGVPLATIGEDDTMNIRSGHIEFAASSVIRYSAEDTDEATMTGTMATASGEYGTIVLTRVGADGITPSATGGRINWAYTRGDAQALRFDETYIETINILVGPDANSLQAGVIIVYVVGANDPLTAGTAIPQQSATQDMEFVLPIPDTAFMDADMDDPRTYTPSDDPNKALPTWLSIVENETGGFEFRGTPEAGDVLPASELPITIYFMAHDSGGHSLESSFELTIVNVNDPPVVNELIQNVDVAMRTVTQGEAFNFQVSEDAFADPDLRTMHDTLTWSAQMVTTDSEGVESLSALPTWLTFTPSTRTFSGMPNNDDARAGNVEVRVTVTDTGTPPLTESQDFTIVVVDIDDPPVPMAANVTLPNGEQGTYYETVIPLDAFADENPDSLTWSVAIVNEDMTTTDIPQGETEDYTRGLFFDPDTRTLSGTPTNDAVGTPLNLRITVNDGENPAVYLDTTLTIANVNDAPVGEIPDQVYAAGVSAFELDFSDFITDPDDKHLPTGQTALTFAVVGSVPDWLGTLTDGVFRGGPVPALMTPGVVEEHTIMISVTEAIAESTEMETTMHEFKLTVHGPPTITAGDLTAVNENDAGYVEITTITFTDDLVNPSEFINISVSDSLGMPSAYFRLSEITSTGALTGTATLYKIAGEALDYEMGATQTVTISVHDGRGGIATQNVTIMVNDINEAPIVNATGFGDQPRNIDTTTPLTINLTGLFTDPDDPTMAHGMLTVTATVDGNVVTDASTPIGFDATADNGNGALVIAADATAGIYRIVLTATDGDTTTPLTATHSFLLALNDAGGATAMAFGSPGNIIPPAFSDSDPAYSYTIPATAFTMMGEAFELDVLRADGTALPQWLSFDGTTLTGTPPASGSRALELVLKATEMTSMAESFQFFTLNLHNTNTAPTLTGETSVAIAAGMTTVTDTLNFDDETSNELLTITPTQSVTYGAFTFVRDNNAGTYAWTYTLTADDPEYKALAAGVAGDDEEFTVTISDGVLDQTATITVTGIQGINDRPENGANPINNDVITAFTAGIHGGEYSIPDDAFSDPDGDDVTLSVSALPMGLLWDADNNRIHGTADASVAGDHDIIVTATDGGGLTHPQTITLRIAPPPVTQGSTIDDRTYVTDREYTIVMTAVSAFDTTNIGSVAVVYTAQLSLNGGTDWETIGTDTHGWSFDSAANTISTTRMEEMDSELPATAHQVRFLATPANGEPVPSDAVVVTFDINDTPTVGNDITIPTAFNGVTGWNFRILAAAFRDADTVDSITAGTLTVSAEYDSGGGTYVAVLNDDSHWLNYAADTRTFSGMPDTIGEVVTIRLTATDPSMASVSRNISFTVAADVQKGANIGDETIITGRQELIPLPSNAFTGDDVSTATITAQVSTDGGGDAGTWTTIEVGGTNDSGWDFDSNIDTIYTNRGESSPLATPHVLRFVATPTVGAPVYSDEFTVTFDVNDAPTSLNNSIVLNPLIGSTDWTFLIPNAGTDGAWFSDLDGDVFGMNGGLAVRRIVIFDPNLTASTDREREILDTFDNVLNVGPNAPSPWLEFTLADREFSVLDSHMVVAEDFTLHVHIRDFSSANASINVLVRPIAALPTTGATITDPTFITGRDNGFYVPADAFGGIAATDQVGAQVSTNGGTTWTAIGTPPASDDDRVDGRWYFDPDAVNPDNANEVGKLTSNQASVPGTQMVRFVVTPGGDDDPVYSDEFAVNFELNVKPEDLTDPPDPRPEYNPVVGATDFSLTLDPTALFSDPNGDNFADGTLKYWRVVITQRDSGGNIDLVTNGAATSHSFWLSFDPATGAITSTAAAPADNFSIHIVMRDASNADTAANINIRPVEPAMPEKGTAVDVTGHKFITGREDEFFVPDDAFMNRGTAVLSAQVWNGTDDWDDITTNDGTAGEWNFDPDTGRLYSNRAETSNTDFMFRFGATPDGGTPVYTDAFTLPVEVNQGPQAANGMIIPMPMVGDAHGDWTFKIPDVGEANAWFTDANGDNFADGTLKILRVVEVYGGGAPFERELVDDRPLFRLDTPGANAGPAWLAFDKDPASETFRTFSIIDGQKVPAVNFVFHVVVQDDSGTANGAIFTAIAGVNIPLRPQLVLRKGDTIDAQTFVTARVDEFYIPADAFIGRGSETLSAQVHNGTDWVDIAVDTAGTTAGTWYFDPDAVNPDNPNEIGRLYSNRNETSNTDFMIRFGATPTGGQPVYTDQFTLTVDVNGRPGDGTLNMGTAFTQNPTIGSTTFAYEIPANAFNDPDGDNFADGTLTYETVVIADREGLTSGQNITIVQNGAAVANHGFWLSFDPTTGIASATSAVGDKYFTLHVVGEDLSGELVGANIPIVPQAAPTSSADPTKTRDIPDINIPTGTDITPINLYTHFQDADDDTLTFTLSGNPAWLSVNADGELVGTPDARGTHTVTISVDDDDDATAAVTDEFVITVVNASPVYSTAITDVMGTTNIAITAIDLNTHFSDADTSRLSYFLSGNPDWLELTGTDLNMLTGTPDAAGSHTVTVIASDGVRTARGTFNITVPDAAPPPPDNRQGYIEFDEPIDDPLDNPLTPPDQDVI